MAGEFDFIQWVRAQQARSGLVQVPAGDDLAVLKWPADELLIVGVDQVLDGVHFDSSIHSAQEIGRKVVNRNFSDCAAMACLPAALVVSAALPKGVGLEYAQQLYLGMREAADTVRARVRDAEVEIFEKAGHAVFVDEPERFNRVVERFVQRLR